MAVQEVNKKLLRELEAMGFPLALATKALRYSGNATLNDAVNWVIDHQNDSNVDNMHDVLINIDVEAPKQFEITEAMRMKAQELRDRVRKKKEEKKLERQREKKKEEKQSEREREKERIRAGKEFNETKRIAEENERKRNLDLRKAEKEEEKRAREKILKKLEQDKVERRGKLGLPLGGPAAVKPPTPQEGNNLFPFKSVTKAEPMRDCLRSLKRNHKHADARVKRALQTLMIYVGNVMRNPNEEKFRKIRLSNPLFQDRVGRLKGGVEFLELCGFERIEGDDDEFLILPRDKVDMAVLNSAGSQLRAAVTNPFFGLLQRED